MKKLLFSILFAMSAPLPVLAGDPALGVWQAPPDAKGQIGYIRIADCGTELCATIIRAFDPQGKEIVTANIGKRILWHMKPIGNGRYGGGRVYVPAHNREYSARMNLQGQSLSVQGCVGAVCRGQIWTRVQ